MGHHDDDIISRTLNTIIQLDTDKLRGVRSPWLDVKRDTHVALAVLSHALIKSERDISELAVLVL